MADSIKTLSLFGRISNLVISLLWKVGYMGVGGGILVGGLLYAKQDSLLYIPEIGDLPRKTAENPRSYRSPAEYHLPYESHMILCEDGVSIHSWLLLQKDSTNFPTIIFFHGNAGNIGMRLPNAQKMYKETKANILMVEYRGYGDSQSVKITEAGLKLDAEAALNFIRARSEIDPRTIFCFGRSLGGAVAFHLALYSEQNKQKNGQALLAGLMIENTFLSISKMVDRIMPWVAPMKFLILRIGWESERIAPTLSLPVLYLAGDRDELVPFSHMKELYKLSRKSSTYPKMYIIPGGTHNDSWVKGGKEYYAQMSAFLSNVVSNDGEIPRQVSEVNIDDQVNHETSSVAIGMAGDTEIPNGMGSIPIMPTNLVAMAKEASRRSVPDETDKKQK